MQGTEAQARARGRGSEIVIENEGGGGGGGGGGGFGLFNGAWAAEEPPGPKFRYYREIYALHHPAY